MAAPLVVDYGRRLNMLPGGRVFYKMSGSGNDFVLIDATVEPAGYLMDAQAVRAICASHTGIGADGLVFLERSDVADFRMVYLNSDGSRADLCGNASLCSTRLAAELGILDASHSEYSMETDAGVLQVRLHKGLPQIDLNPVSGVQLDYDVPLEPGEAWAVFVQVGVPHLVIRVDEVATVDVVRRGRPLRFHSSLKAGANVNFVSSAGEGKWLIRTYERGVEAETMACGTGSIASAIALHASGASPATVPLTTRSGMTLTVRLRAAGTDWLPSLSGEARIVYQGRIGELESQVAVR